MRIPILRFIVFGGLLGFPYFGKLPYRVGALRIKGLDP